MKSICIAILSIPKFIPRYEEFNIKSMNVADNIPVDNAIKYILLESTLFIIVLESIIPK